MSFGLKIYNIVTLGFFWLVVTWSMFFLFTFDSSIYFVLDMFCITEYIWILFSYSGNFYLLAGQFSPFILNIINDIVGFQTFMLFYILFTDVSLPFLFCIFLVVILVLIITIFNLSRLINSFVLLLDKRVSWNTNSIYPPPDSLAAISLALGNDMLS